MSGNAFGFFVCFFGFYPEAKTKKKVLYNSFLIKGLSRAEKDKDPFHVPHPWLHEQSNVLAHGFAHADQILLSFGVLLMAYYLVFGLIITIKFGCDLTNVAFSVICYPPIVVFIGLFM